MLATKIRTQRRVDHTLPRATKPEHTDLSHRSYPPLEYHLVTEAKGELLGKGTADALHQLGGSAGLVALREMKSGRERCDSFLRSLPNITETDCELRYPCFVKCSKWKDKRDQHQPRLGSTSRQARTSVTKSPPSTFQGLPPCYDLGRVREAYLLMRTASPHVQVARVFHHQRNVMIDYDGL